MQRGRDRLPNAERVARRVVGCSNVDEPRPRPVSDDAAISGRAWHERRFTRVTKIRMEMMVGGIPGGPDIDAEGGPAVECATPFADGVVQAIAAERLDARAARDLAEDGLGWGSAAASDRQAGYGEDDEKGRQSCAHGCMTRQGEGRLTITARA